MLTKSYQERTVLYAFLLVPIFFGASYFLLHFYVDGDQVHYHRFYNSLKFATFQEVPSLALAQLSSREVLSPYLIWIGASLGIDKNVYVSFLNVLLLSGIFLILRKHHVSWLAVALVLTNFYTVVLLTGAERLKIAFIIIVYAFYFSGLVRNVLLFLSPMAHFQSLLFFPSIIFCTLAKDVKIFLRRRAIRVSSFRMVVVAGLSSFFIAYFFWDGIFIKGASHAARDTSALELLNIIILSFVSIFVAVNKFRIMMALLPFYPMIAILGGMRINMLAVVTVIYLLMVEHKLNHPAMILMLTYFSYKSVPFIKNIIVYGNGFF
ncbi:hypothetical protein [Billgrantia aerodenitrificans]|uniref:EpsG family protein n=1 Tax=Billgrantia aerodenitrificans TaxID=2733483 RepID=A0ABS9AVM1_9GAMM|nr:hypothetical protein [Halomonas aerodenitrificans]MCE8025742.1 hypothetical protein [Halomonas aerodenitrificans]